MCATVFISMGLERRVLIHPHAVIHAVIHDCVYGSDTWLRVYSFTYTCTYRHIHTHLHTHTYTHTYTHLHTHTYTHTPTHLHTPTHTPTHTYRHLHTPTHTYTHTYTHPHTHTHTHTHTHSHTLLPFFLALFWLLVGFRCTAIKRDDNGGYQRRVSSHTVTRGTVKTRVFPSEDHRRVKGGRPFDRRMAVLVTAIIFIFVVYESLLEQRPVGSGVWQRKEYLWHGKCTKRP